MRNRTTPTLLKGLSCCCRYLARCLFLLQYHTLIISVCELDFECNLLKIVTTHLKKSDLHPAPLLIAESHTASRSAVFLQLCSCSAASCQMRRHHAAWHCELHLHVSTCGWLMCCFIYFLGCLSVIHPRMSLPMRCESDHCLSLVCLCLICFPLLSWETTVWYVRSVSITFSTNTTGFLNL